LKLKKKVKISVKELMTTKEKQKLRRRKLLSLISVKLILEVKKVVIITVKEKIKKYPLNLKLMFLIESARKSSL